MRLIWQYLNVIKLKKKNNFLNYVCSTTNVKQILLIRNGMIGDTVSITSVLNKLLERYPAVIIDLVIGEHSIGLLDNFPNVRNIYPFRFDYSIKSILRQIVFFYRLGKRKYVLMLVQEVNTHFTIMSKIVRAKYTLGFENNMSWLYDYAVTRPLKTMAVAESETVLEWTNSNSKIRTSLYVSIAEKENIVQLLEKNGVSKGQKYMVFHPGSHSKNSYRQWNVQGYVETADYFAEYYGWKIIFTGVEQDYEVISQIIGKMNFEGISFAGKLNLKELIAVIQAATLVIGPDTGTLHIAAAVNTFAVMLMGISDPLDTGIYNSDGKSSIVRSGLSCSPCVNLKIKPKQWEKCRNMHPVECMNQLKSVMVIQAVKDMMGVKIKNRDFK